MKFPQRLSQNPAGPKWKKGQLVEMANDNQLNESNALQSDADLGTLGDSLELVFVFGVLFQSSFKESAQLACRNLVVPFRIV